MPSCLSKGRHDGGQQRFILSNIGHELLLGVAATTLNMRASGLLRDSLSPRAPRTAPDSLDPKKTPGQSRSAATVAAVLEAAARILESKGFAGYTTNAVARRVGVSIGSLYQYFPSKDAITKALIVWELNELVAEVAAIDAEASGREGLQRLIAVAVAYQLRRPVLARLLDQEERRLPVDEEIKRVGEQLALSVRRCLDAPDLAAPRPAFAAEDLLAIVKGVVDAAGERGEGDAAALVTRVRRAVFGYLENTSGQTRVSPLCGDETAEPLPNSTPTRG